MTSKDLQLINEKYHQIYAQNRAQQMLNEGSRRDFLKQSAGTVAALITNPIAKAADAAKKVVYDLTDAVSVANIQQILWRSGIVQGFGDAAEQKLNALSNKLHRDFLNGKINKQILEMLIASSGTYAPYIKQIQKPIVDACAETAKKSNLDPRAFTDEYDYEDEDEDASEIENASLNDAIDGAAQDVHYYDPTGELMNSFFKKKKFRSLTRPHIKDIFDLILPGDITINGKVIVTAEKAMEKGIFKPAEHVLKTIKQDAEDLFKALFWDLYDENLGMSEVARGQHRKELQQKQAKDEQAKAKDDIEYSPADYLGGAPAGGSEQHGYKLAVDSVNIHTLYLQVISEGTQMAKQLVVSGKLSNEDFNKLKAADPTKEKFKYVDWMAAQWIKQPQSDLQTLTNAMKEFDDLSKANRFEGAANDIQSYKSLEELSTAIDELKQSGGTTSAKQLKEDYDVEVNNDDIIVVAPKTHAASRKLGLSEFRYRVNPVTGKLVDSNWCITFSNDQHWNEYVHDEHLSFYFIRIKSDRLKKLLFKHEKFNSNQYLIVAVVVAPENSNQYSKGLSGVTATDKTMPQQDFSEYLKIIEPFLDGKTTKDILVDKKLYLERNKQHGIKSKQNLKNWLEGRYEGEVLDLRSAPFTTLPNNIHSIDRGINLSDSNISSLQNIVEVNGNLYLQKSKIAALNPDKLTVNGALNLDYCKNITTLPRTLKCKSLNVTRSGITSLPDHLHIDNVLYIQDTSIKTIPQGLKLTNGYFKGSQIETIPRDFECVSMDIRDTPFAKKYSLQQMKEMLPNVQRIKI
jgi:hypothetical protein